MYEEAIVTSFSAEGYKEYGKRLLDTYAGNSPFPLIVFTGGMDELPHEGVIHRRQEEIPELVDFLARWAGNDMVAGKKPNEKWKPKDYAKGYNYRYDAWKFCKMVFVMQYAAQFGRIDRMLWLDGDCEIRQRLPDNLFDRFLPFGKDYSYLGREPKYSETGFVMFRTAECQPILRRWADYYNKDEFLAMQEWHSAWLFDRAREQFPAIRGHDLTPGKTGHVIHQCPVGTFIDHKKGKRKTMRRSPEAR